jgi:hypothetical protein
MSTTPTTPTSTSTTPATPTESAAAAKPAAPAKTSPAKAAPAPTPASTPKSTSATKAASGQTKAAPATQTKRSTAAKKATGAAPAKTTSARKSTAAKAAPAKAATAPKPTAKPVSASKTPVKAASPATPEAAKEDAKTPAAPSPAKDATNAPAADETKIEQVKRQPKSTAEITQAMRDAAKAGVEAGLKGTDKITSVIVKCPRPFPRDKRDFGWELAKALRCNAVMMNGFEKDCGIEVTGHQADVDRFLKIHTLLAENAEILLGTKEFKARGNALRAEKREWLLGYCETAVKQVKRIESEAAKGTKDGKSIQEILDQRAEKAQAAFRAKYADLKFEKNGITFVGENYKAAA